MSDEKRPSTRDRLLDATVSLMRTKGSAGSGTMEILKLAEAPRGSFYFHFPEGKDQLVLEALERAAAATLASLVEALADDEGDLAEQVRAIFGAIEAELLAEDYAPGCAVAATTMERAAISVSFREAVDAVFTGWTSTLSARLSQRGIAPERAAALADTIIAATEGATIMARAQHSPIPLRHNADILGLAIAQLALQ